MGEAQQLQREKKIRKKKLSSFFKIFYFLSISSWSP